MDQVITQEGRRRETACTQQEKKINDQGDNDTSEDEEGEKKFDV